MHVLYLHQYFVTNHGASGTRSYDFARALVSRGHTVTLVTGHLQGDGVDFPPGQMWVRRDIDGIDVIYVRAGYTQGLGAAARLWSWLSYAGLAGVVGALGTRPDVIFATCTPPTVALPAIALARNDTPFVYELRDIWPEGLADVGLAGGSAPALGMRALNVLAFTCARRLVTIAPGLLDVLVEQYGIEAARIALIPIGADERLYPERPAPLSENPLRHLARDGDMVVVYAGAMGPVNHLDYLIDVAVELRDREDIRFVLVGDGSQRPSLQMRAEALALRSVTFTGPIPKATLAAALPFADVGVNCVAPGRQNAIALPNKAFDYLMAALPILTTAPAQGGGTLQVLVEEHGCGAGADAADPRVAAAVLRRWADDPLGRREMGRRGRALGLSRFAREGLVDALESTLQGARAERTAAIAGPRAALRSLRRAIAVSRAARTREVPA